MHHYRCLFLCVATIWASPCELYASATPSSVDAPAEVLKTPISHPAIEELNALLTHYRDIEEVGGWPQIADGPLIRPALMTSDAKAFKDVQDERIPAIRQILKIMGDHPIDDAASKDSTSYDIDLQEAVKNFQRRHGLKDDGIIGTQTSAALNVPVSFRIKQIIATLERLKQIPDSSPRYILVNIPAFELRAYDHNQSVLQARVVVGTPKRATPVMSTRLTYVSFNPPWGVPISIASEEMLPKIMADPEYLKNHRYKVFEIVGDSRFEVDETIVPWDTLSRQYFPYLIMQAPGAGNALGKIKFGLEKSNGIYIHDTSSRKYFGRDLRALSHGCVRVEDPRALAHYVFAPMERHSREKIDKLYDSDTQKILRVDPIDVHLVYWTAWVDNKTASPHFRQDIYRKDALLADKVIAEQESPSANEDQKEMEESSSELAPVTFATRI